MTMIKKNDRIKLKITDMGTNGEGIGKYMDPGLQSAPANSSAQAGQMMSETSEKAGCLENTDRSSDRDRDQTGLTFFVKNALIGDEVLALVTKMKKGYGYAKVLEILQPSPDRIQPVCPLADRCGGCQIMQLDYEAQLSFKENKVRSMLKHLAGVEPDEFLPIIGMDREESCNTPLHFRNKMQFPVGWDREGHVVTGFYAGRTHYIVGSESCPVSPQINDYLLGKIREFLEKHRLSTYNEESGKGLIRHILIRNGFYTGQIMICLVINADVLEDETYSRQGHKRQGKESREKERRYPLEQEFVAFLTSLPLEAPWTISSICLNINKERTNVILGTENRCIYGNPYIEDMIRTGSGTDKEESLIFRINPMSFFQINPYQTGKLYQTALDFAGLSGSEKVWDLYCGTGTISLFLAKKAGEVHGVEIIPEAIEDARANAQRNGITNASFYCGRSEEVFPEKAAADGTVDVVVLDPPRKGCERELLEVIRKVGPERIVYVSCDPATLARDIKILCEEKDTPAYRLEKVQPVDMFPHTVHVETVCCLYHQKKDFISVPYEPQNAEYIK